jgi:DNA-binding protein H-NS
MNQIERLQKEAAAIQSSVITRIKREIAQYGLTVEQLFGEGNGSGKENKAKPTSRKSARPSGDVKFADANGNTWPGKGKRPKWLREALAAGHSLDEFLLARKGRGSVGAPAAQEDAPKPTRKRAPSKRAVAKKAVAQAKPGKVAAKAKRPAAKTARKRPVKKAVSSGAETAAA